MSEKGAPSRSNRGQPSITYYIGSALVLSSLLTVTALLTVNFWVTRPVNFQNDADSLANELEAALIDSYIPPQNIVRDTPTPESIVRDGIETRWNAHNFTLTLPPRVKVEQLKDQLSKTMSSYFAKLVEIERDPVTNHDRFALYLDDLQVATLELVPGEAATDPNFRSDLRDNSLQLANLVDSELSALSLNPPHVRSEVENREDLNAIWYYTRFRATLPPGMTLGALKGRLEARNAEPGATFSTDVGSANDVNLLVRVAGKACVGIDCILSPANGEARRPGPVLLDQVLEGGLLGSDPDEQVQAPPLEGEGMIAITPVPTEYIQPTEVVDPADEKAATPDVAPVAPPLEPSAPVEPDVMSAPNSPEPPTKREAPAVPEESPESSEAAAAEKPEAPMKLAKRETTEGDGIAAPTTARVAILIDDGGNNSSHGDRILALDNRLTLAILPNTPFGVRIAEQGAQKGFEIMLHMPMETDSGTVPSVPGTVFTKMDKEEIQKLTNAAIDQIPFLAGINNHTGSKFTSNKEKMKFVLEVVQERGLYFIDSVTINTTVAFQTAQEMGLPSGRRDVFLDNATDEASVRRQFAILLDTALKKGSAIGIGHFQSPATARVLAQEIPKLAEAGIELVHASELMQ